MALARETDATLVQPMNGALTRYFEAGSAIEAGMPVATASDGAIDPADSSDTSLSFTQGIALGPTDWVAGDGVAVVWAGPVRCMTGATPGALVYVSDTAGSLSHTAGTKSTIIGVAESATVLMVRPQYVSLS
ncbi:MAG: hypothetical protein WBO46_27295 [Caldilineaceae bacterium]